MGSLIEDPRMDGTYFFSMVQIGEDTFGECILKRLPILFCFLVAVRFPRPLSVAIEESHWDGRVGRVLVKRILIPRSLELFMVVSPLLRFLFK